MNKFIVELEYSETVGDKLLTRIRIKDVAKQQTAVGINVTCYGGYHELNEKISNLLNILNK